MGKLSDILRNNNADIESLWDSTDAAGDFSPLPAGTYDAHVIDGELANSRTKGTAGYKITFKVCEGEHEGRRFFLDLWLTASALPMTKRDLAKFGVTDLQQLEQPLPQGIRCRCKVVLRVGDDGADYNRVRSFEVIGIDEPGKDDFAPVVGSDDKQTEFEAT